MKSRPLLVWTAANAIGLGVAFIAIAETTMLFEYGLDFDKHWQFVPPGQTVRAYAARLVASLVGGAILGSAQAIVLRSRLLRVLPWILATSFGFGLVGLFIWTLMAANIWGRIPGPVEPLVGTVGSCTLAGIFQYWVLRRQGSAGLKWLVLWIVGLIVSILPTALLFMSIEAIELPLSWPVEVFLNGLVCAGVAAMFNGRALFAAVSSGPAMSPPSASAL